MQIILQKYVLKEFFRIFIPTIFAFEFLLILGLVLQSMQKGADVMAIIVSLLPYFVLYALPYALPTALLTATIITFGRLSGDNEIWAMLTSGIHLRTLVVPVALVGLFFSFVSVAINAEVLPRSYQMLTTMRDKATHQILQHLAAAGGMVKMDPYYINIQEIRGDAFRDITIFKAEGDKVSNVIMARDGRLDIEMEENLVVCALRDGAFISISQDSASSAPTVIPFEETTFVMPLGLREHKTMRKYMPFFKLLEYKKKVKSEIRKHRDILGELEPGKRALERNAKNLRNQLSSLQGQIQQAKAQAEKARETISLERVNITNIKNEIQISQGYVRVTEETLGELVLAKEMAQAGRRGKSEEVVNIEKKMVEVNKTIEDETVRLLEAEEAKLQAEMAIEREEQRLAGLSDKLAKLGSEEHIKSGDYKKAKRLAEVAEHQETRRDISVAIHRRLSPGLSSLAFVLIGIPIGIMTRMGNMVIGFFISFGVALVVYYPLLIMGESLARKQGFPPGPTMWGANIVLGIIAIFLLAKLFRK
ncbi:MAG: LptF/LptG family permease [Candidatus Brocadiales bacterium]